MAFSERTGSKIEIFIRCSQLVNLDYLTKSDPLCVLYTKHEELWSECGRTEVINDTLDPQFSTTFIVDYYLDELQPLKFEVYDVDSNSADLSSHDFIGEAQVNLSNIILSSPELVKELRLPKSPQEKRGRIHLVGEEVIESKSVIRFDIAARNVENKCSYLESFIWNSSPFLELRRRNEDGSQLLLHKTEVVKNSANPHWTSFEIPSWKLCNSDYTRSIEFTCKHWKTFDTAVVIGRAFASVEELLSQRVSTRNLVSSSSNDKRSGAGTLLFQSVSATPVYSFVDYLRGGCGLSVMVAVDFTSSNGDPNLPNSLHCNGPTPNAYVEAITSVGEILAEYDSDQKFPAWGFGAVLPVDTARTSHCFPLSGNMYSPEVHGVEGILTAYRASLASARLSGPTLFSPILEAALRYVQSESVSQENQTYNILLIVTDGVIHDMENTIDKIVEASDEALSIIVVGVGNADFSQMETLDADTVPLTSSTGRTMSRDIVQFVSFRELRHRIGMDFSLARQVLAEVPNQLVSFMKRRGITPNAAAAAAVPPTAGDGGYET
ncbi:copine-5-like [Oscarella lobularis]|uniref:copine-5-like n=1 Tax=Oscarella lobularis TaxID=121494 RepID=UPI0033137714